MQLDAGTYHDQRLSTLAPHYDLILCDVWGVIHNGTAVHTEAERALKLFRAQGGLVILVSNASRLAPMVATQSRGVNLLCLRI